MFVWKSWLGLGATAALSLAAAVLIIAVTAIIAHGASRRREGAKLLASKARHPYRLLVITLGLWAACEVNFPLKSLFSMVNHGFLVITIVFSTWLLGALLAYGLGLAAVRYDAASPDSRLARRARTQLQVVRRLLVAIVIAVGVASVLLTFPGVQALGASVLASAGVVSIVAGLAAQSTLGNVFAGVQLAFSDAIRVDDVVVINGEWGRIEEVTLTYVVVHVWDDRRLVVPSTYFTSTPFENWTRTGNKLLGAIDFDLDWRVNAAAMRKQLGVILSQTSNWDERAQVLQVTDAVGGYVHVRILVSATDSPTLFDLRCYVREQMVDWIQQTSPQTMPRQRVQLGEEAPQQKKSTPPKSDQIGLFSGDEGQQRASEFTASQPTVKDTAQDS